MVLGQFGGLEIAADGLLIDSGKRDPAGHRIVGGVRASTYGFLTKEFYVPRGFESPREVILTDFFRNALTTKIIRTQYYDLFYSETDKEVFALYLNRIKGWNANYQTLLFLFKNGTTFKDHAKMVEKIMKKFVPSFARQD